MARDPRRHLEEARGPADPGAPDPGAGDPDLGEGTAPEEVGTPPAGEVVERIVPHPPERYTQPIEFDEVAREVSIGVVVPFDFELDWEYWRYLPEGVSLFFTRTPHLKRAVGIPLARQVGRPTVVGRAGKTLNTLEPAATLYACSSGSFVWGLAGEEQIRRSMLDSGARHAVTTSGAMLDAMRAGGAERVAVATPYTKPLTEKLVGFLEEAGYDVISTHYLGLANHISSVSRSTIADLIRATHHPRVDAVYVSCTALRTYGVVAAVEEEIGVPVFTANQVSLWAALKAASAEHLDPEHPGWVIGGGQPMARSTEILIDAAQQARRGVA